MFVFISRENSDFDVLPVLKKRKLLVHLVKSITPDFHWFDSKRCHRIETTSGETYHATKYWEE